MPFRPPFSPLRAPRVFRISAPSPTKKLLKGDSYWATHHIVLGWLVDTVRLTIEPPSLRVERLLALLASVEPSQKRIEVIKWHPLPGELHSVLLGIPRA
jgi:hypothetical protein